MAKPKDPKHFKFSYSSTDTFDTCQYQFYQVNWLRIPEYQDSDNDQNIRGTQMHDECEHAVLEDREYDLPDELHPDKDYTWILDRFRARTGLKIPEMQLAIDKAWNPVDYKDPTAWYRAKIDFSCINGTHLWIDDLKTGKRKFKSAYDHTRWLQERHVKGRAPTKDELRWLPDPTDYIQSNSRQIAEYALLMFLHLPHIDTITSSLVWSDVEGVTEDIWEFDRARDSEVLLQTMLHTPSNVEEAARTGTWTKTRSGLCKGWCPVVGCPNWSPKVEKRY